MHAWYACHNIQILGDKTLPSSNLTKTFIRILYKCFNLSPVSSLQEHAKVSANEPPLTVW